MRTAVWALALLGAMSLGCAGVRPIDDDAGDSDLRIVERLHSTDIEERDWAVADAVAQGLRIVPLMEALAEDSDPEVSARARQVLHLLDESPLTLRSQIEALVRDNERSCVQLLLLALRRTARCCESRPWGEVRGALEAQQIALIEAAGSAFTFRMSDLPDVIVKDLPFACRFELSVFTDEAPPTPRSPVRRVAVTLSMPVRLAWEAYAESDMSGMPPEVAVLAQRGCVEAKQIAEVPRLERLAITCLPVRRCRPPVDDAEDLMIRWTFGFESEDGRTEGTLTSYAAIEDSRTDATQMRAALETLDVERAVIAPPTGLNRGRIWATIR